MKNEERKALIHQRLQDAFDPTSLEVIDDSAKHAGHPGSAEGGGHFTVIIEASCFDEKTRIAIHREIYQTLHDLIPHEIHALGIKNLKE